MFKKSGPLWLLSHQKIPKTPLLPTIMGWMSKWGNLPKTPCQTHHPLPKIFFCPMQKPGELFPHSSFHHFLSCSSRWRKGDKTFSWWGGETHQGHQNLTSHSLTHFVVASCFSLVGDSLRDQVWRLTTFLKHSCQPTSLEEVTQPPSGFDCTHFSYCLLAKVC